MNISDVKVYGEKVDQVAINAPEKNSKSDEGNQSERINRAVLKGYRFRVNKASGELFDSCDSPFYAPQISTICSTSLYQRENAENRYSSFTKSIENTPVPSFTLPSPEKDGLSQRLSDEEFNKRKDLCRRGKSVASIIADPFLPQGPCLSLKQGMSDEQKEEFKNVNQEVDIRVATAPLTVVGASSRKVTEVVSKAIIHPVERFCSQNRINQMVCNQVGELSSPVFKNGNDLIPGAFKKSIKNVLRAYHEFIERKADENASKFRIDKQDTRDFYHGALSVSIKALFTGAGVLTHVVKKRPSHLPPPFSVGRIRYSEGYRKSVDCFAKAKQFEGVLSKDLMIVQYHSEKTLRQGRSLKWFTPIAQANKLSTVDQVMDKLALLSVWGSRTHVTVAKIPAGERVKFLHGRAIRQIGRDSLETVEGGGVQYRFYEFDPKWILETRKIP